MHVFRKTEKIAARPKAVGLEQNGAFIGYWHNCHWNRMGGHHYRGRYRETHHDTLDAKSHQEPGCTKQKSA